MKPFRNVNGQWMTKGLFKEYGGSLFRIEDLKALYMAIGDLTEYRFATEHLGGWQHWKVLQQSPFLKEHIFQWREELELKVRSESLYKLLETAKGDNKDAFIANRYFADGQWKAPAEKAQRGRPSKSQVAMAAKELAVENHRLEDDFNRIMNG